MKKVIGRSIGLAIAGVALLMVAGCEAFIPMPSISSFTSNVSSTFVGETVYFTVSGSTKQGGNYSAFQDYAGTVTVDGDGVTGGDAEIEEDFSVTIPVVPNVSGTVEIVATVTDSNGEFETELKTITVGALRANEGTTDNPVRLVFGGAARDSKVGTGTEDESFYRFTPTSSTATITNSGQSPIQDLDFYLYSNPGFTTFLTSSIIAGTDGTWTLFSLTPNDNYYLKVVNWTDTQNTTWDLRVD